ncbi:hypothetical protein BIU82_01070 [Arthrobacter sp. SW1]|uniref:DUF1304 family protein n=1 Tax=Arthrobacter sp. SW1 TaxID=1920889 RepID=UPI000877BD50|nr:DUF1304 family protein [Arthrobacter sp. SW1]OFI40062.1 hypothetical protein BIU82_01070 [Arthrobacter sp. SW1]
MTGAIQVLGVVLGVVLIVVGVLESFFFRDQRFHPIFLIDPKDTAAVRLWTVNLGFYNMVWGVGAITGALLLGGPNHAAGHAILLFACVAHVILGMVLLFSERRLWVSAVGQALLPLVIAVLLLL